MSGLRDRGDEPSVLMMAWDTPLTLPNYTPHLERRKNSVMHGKLKFEWGMPNGMGVFIANEWVEVTSFESIVLRARYPDLPRCFDQYSMKSPRIS